MQALAAKEAAAAAAAASASVQVTVLLRQEAGGPGHEPAGEAMDVSASADAGSAPLVYEIAELPGGDAAREVLEGSKADAQAAADASKRATDAMRSSLGKRTYTEGEKKDRKRNRNDRKPPRGKS